MRDDEMNRVSFDWSCYSRYLSQLAVGKGVGSTEGSVICYRFPKSSR